jgi:dihydropteroate synthase
LKDTYLLDNYSINFKGNLISLTRPVVMSILNTTPDSFFDGGKYNSIEKALKKVEKDLNQGATIIDIGGYSTKPGGKNVTIDEEIRRTIPYIEKIVDTFPDINISIDTFRGKVAALAIDAGAGMINDVSAWNMDKEMFETIKKYNVPYVLMHMKGEPKNMQDNPRYENVTKEVIKFLSNKINKLNSNGINDVVIDPGFGFGKTNSDNYKLLKNMEFLKVLKAPILAGISRKSMIYKTLKINKLESINGTTALNMFALSKGAKILRVHDVKQAMECIYLSEEINSN